MTQRYGARAIPADMTIDDWPVSYDELEPYFDKFDKLCGVSGKAGNLRGTKVEGGNVFEGPRQNEYPIRRSNRRQAPCCLQTRQSAPGYHPFPTPFSAPSRPYTNIYGVTWGSANIVGFAGAIPARQTPRPPRRRMSCPCCVAIRNIR